MKVSTSAFLETTTLHHEGNIAHASFPYSMCTSALPKTTLHCEANLTHASILFIVKEGSRMCPTHASFPFIMKDNTRTSALPTTKVR